MSRYLESSLWPRNAKSCCQQRMIVFKIDFSFILLLSNFCFQTELASSSIDTISLSIRCLKSCMSKAVSLWTFELASWSFSLLDALVQYVKGSLTLSHLGGGGGGGFPLPWETFLNNSKTAQDIKMNFFKINLTLMGVILHIMTILINLRCCHGNLLL